MNREDSYMSNIVVSTDSVLAIRSGDAWAQVARTLQSKPWVRFVVQMPEGIGVPDGTEPPQTRLSSEQKSMATKKGDQAGSQRPRSSCSISSY